MFIHNCTRHRLYIDHNGIEHFGMNSVAAVMEHPRMTAFSVWGNPAIAGIQQIPVACAVSAEIRASSGVREQSLKPLLGTLRVLTAQLTRAPSAPCSCLPGLCPA